MATQEECEKAIGVLGERLGGLEHGSDNHRKVRRLPDRTLSCTLLDLDVTFNGLLHEGHLVDVTTESRPRAQIRLLMTSDDLLAMTDGELSFSHAWATGRVRLDASLRDLLHLRALL